MQVERLLDELDLRDVRELYEDHGGIAYDPKCLLGVLLLGYTLGVYASRQMEDRCRFDLRFMHASGRPPPDSRTLAAIYCGELERTRQGAREALGEVPECTVADAGYESAQNLETAETLGTEA